MAEADALIDNNYLKEHSLRVYLEDAIAQMHISHQEAKKPETSTPPIKIPPIRPCRFFKEYFLGIRHGNHVLFREFAFASATPYNRLSVMTSLLEAYRNHLFKEDKHNAKDYHSMLQLVWPDFPMQVVQDAFSAYEGEDKNDEKGIKFLDFVKCLKASFCTGDCDYESSILNTVLDDKLNELTEIFAQGGDIPKSLFEAEYLVNVRDPKKPQPLAFTHKILDGSEFKRLLNFNDTCSISSDEPEPEPEPISESSESKKSVSKGKKKGKSKKGASQSKGTAQNKTTVQSKTTAQGKTTTQKITTQTKSTTLPKSSTAPAKTASQIKIAAQIKSMRENKIVRPTKADEISSQNVGYLGGKHLSASLNVILQSGRGEADKHKHRSRSRSVTADQRSSSKKPWRP